MKVAQGVYICRMRDAEQPQKILIVDDDTPFATTLANSFRKRGFLSFMSNSEDNAIQLAQKEMPELAVVDLKLWHSNGLKIVEKLKEINNDIRIVVLTGYGSISTAVSAIRLGACHYLLKPSGTIDIITAFDRTKGNFEVDIGDKQNAKLKIDKWELINSALSQNDFNISETARQLGMHRRTLARILNRGRKQTS